MNWIQRFLTAIATHKADPNAHHTPGAIDLNKVKLPSPSASDYVTPSDALASTEVLPIDMSVLELRIQSGGITDKANIYDGLDDTIATPNGTMPVGTREIMVWDFESIAERTVTYKMSIGVGSSKVLIHYSTDDISYTLIDEVTAGQKSGSSTHTFRYLKWEIYAGMEASGGYFKLHTLFVGESFRALRTIDEDLALQWRPNPANEVNAWCRWDMGALKITSGCRIYWGADADYRPIAYRIEVSENGTTWTTVKTETEAAPASAWKEYSWNARYARYIRMIVDTHGATGTEVFEADYYSRLLDRVAAEHGHGSGVTPHLRVKHSKGHPLINRGDTLRGKVKDLPSLIEWLDFILKE